jgi:hypothetical protein
MNQVLKRHQFYIPVCQKRVTHVNSARKFMAANFLCLGMCDRTRDKTLTHADSVEKNPYIKVNSLGTSENIQERNHIHVLYVTKNLDRSLVRESGLSYHHKLHTRVKAHKCEVCGRRFARKSYLTMHEIIHTQ